jgi:hypothetical protein
VSKMSRMGMPLNVSALTTCDCARDAKLRYCR